MIRIRPKVAMFGAFSRLNYKPWFALAEFIDNSLQSFLANRAMLTNSSLHNESLCVDLSIEDDRIVIHDNAAGIRAEDFPRAFVPAQPPPDTSGLSEFGLGMKAAACWFAKSWRVRTCALGEGVERTVLFNVFEIVSQDIEELEVQEKNDVPKAAHYTTLTLERLNQRIRGRTLSKIKAYLAGIYRAFLASGDLRLRVNGESLQYVSPAILHAPYYNSPSSSAVEWKKDVYVELDSTHRVFGWAALRAKMSTVDTGFAVFRRGRVILGSGDSPYRPEQLFRRANSFAYQRLFGELHVEGFEVSHTKDGLQWDEWEDNILDELKRQLNAEPLKLLTQAAEHRVRGSSRAEEDPSFGDEATAKTATALLEHAGPVVAAQLAAGPEPNVNPPELLPEVRITARRDVTLELEHDGRRWRVTIELSAEEGIEDWYSFSRRAESGTTEVTVRLSLSHPFTERFALKSDEELEPLIRIAAALALAELCALDVGISPRVKTLRRNFNTLLRDALAK